MPLSNQALDCLLENRRLHEEVKDLRLKLAELTKTPFVRETHTVPPWTLDEEAQRQSTSPVNGADEAHITQQAWQGLGHSLSKAQVERYSRQILLHSFGAKAQDALCRSSVLVIGAGGLGCPAAIYLASAGVGRLGIVDKDTVELINLHRQILHREVDVGMHKAVSAAAACQAINSTVQVVAHTEGFLPSNALQLVADYDIVVDSSDNAPTRYLISDACCVMGKPLVSGAAIATDGQLTVYCYEEGPCYRCLYPEPPQPESCSRCSEAGVLGPVPGFIGTLQALEAIKIITGVGSVTSQKLLLADCLSGRFSTVKLRNKQPGCVACGSHPRITADSLPAFDYAAFTGQAYDDGISDELCLLPKEQRVSPSAFSNRMDPAAAAPVIVDVRPRTQFEAAHLPGSLHLPYDEQRPQRFQELLEAALQQGGPLTESDSITVVCRRGNDSQRAVEIMQQKFELHAVDLEGGLLAWSKFTDFPGL